MSELWPHQVKAFNYAVGKKGSALFLDMGGGKSFTAIRLLEQWDAKTVVILCPKSVVGVWPKQIAEHGRGRWATWSVGQYKGTVNKKAQLMLTWYLIPQAGARKVFIINYDAAWRLPMAKQLLAMKPDALILDESHKIKAPGGKASIFASKLARHSKRVLGLTGTPMPYGFQDLYAQYRAIDPSVYGTSFTRFKSTYAMVRPINDRVDKIIGFRDERAEQEFTEKMGSIGLVIKRDEMQLDVPGRLRPVIRECPLDDRTTWRLYREVRDEFIAELDAGIVTADNALTKLLRLRQITSGHVRTTDGAVVTVGKEKAALLAETLEDVLPTSRDRPIVVFGVFHHDLDVVGGVADTLGLRSGELSGRRRDGLAADSTIADDLDIIGVQLQSGGVGVDFTRAHTGIYYSIDFNLGNVEQSLARLDRPGQTVPVTFIHLVATTPDGKQTVDGVTYYALHKRRALNEAVLEALQNREL